MFRVVHDLIWRVRRFVTELASRLLIQLWRLLMAPAVLGHTVLVNLGRLFMWWWENRRMRHLLFGLPALVLFSVSGYLAAAAMWRQKGVTAERYVVAGKKAMNDKRYEAAALYFERAVELQPGDNETLADLCSAVSETQDYARVDAILAMLAPDDRPVHALSHYRRARNYLAQRPQTTEMLLRAEKQLQNVLMLQAENRDSILLLWETEFALGRFSAAAAQLLKIADEEPRAQLTLAKALALTQDPAGAMRWGTRARDYWEEITRRRPSDVEAYVKAGESLAFLESFPAAVEMLQVGLRVNEKDERLRMGLSRTLVLWSDSLESLPPVERQQQQFELLTNALLAYPNDAMIFDRIMAVLKGGGEPAQKTRDFLLENVADGRAAGMSHLLLGSQATLDGNVAEAELHLQRAFSLMPQAPVVTNNLAWFLAFKEPPEAERALKLIDPVIKLFPRDLRFVDTRGHILRKLGRYREAIDDIERAVPLYGNLKITHEALAECYDAIGHHDLAERHRLKATKQVIPK
jgi:tetratricopeptide (TPR) repeat protein